MDPEQASVLSLKPGEIIHFDCRSNEQKKYAASNCLDAVGRPLKVITWNIERGIELTRIISLLRSIDADIIALQEIDSGCSRSQYIDTGLAIARALQLNYVFQLEFVELGSGDRAQQPICDGVHGNGILTKFDLASWTSLDHTCQPYNWPRDGVLLGEPRLGRRFSLCAQVRVPAVYKLQYLDGLRQEDLSPSCPTQVAALHALVAVYTCHMELFCGLTHRLQVLQELFQHAAAQRTPYQLLMGDFNTLGHSLARLSPKLCLDGHRWRSLGWTEAQWWASHALDYGPDEALNDAAAGGGAAGAALRELLRAQGSTEGEKAEIGARVAALLRNPQLESVGAGALVNPGFVESFSSDMETLTNYRGWFSGKLDYLLTRGCSSVDMHLYNRDYSASDHRMLYSALFLDDRRAHSRGRLFAALRGLPVADEALDEDALDAAAAGPIPGAGSPAADAVVRYRGDTVEFLLRESGPGYSTPASPIAADTALCPRCKEPLTGTPSETALACPEHGWERNAEGRVSLVRKPRPAAEGAGLVYRALPCRLQGHRCRHAGLRGLVRRNATPFAVRAAALVLVVWVLVALLLK